MICKMALHAPKLVSWCYFLCQRAWGLQKHLGNCCLDGECFCRVPSQEQVLLAYGILTGLGALTAWVVELQRTGQEPPSLSQAALILCCSTQPPGAGGSLGWPCTPD